MDVHRSPGPTYTRHLFQRSDRFLTRCENSMIERERESDAIRAPSAGRTIRYRSRDRGITFRTIVVSIICEQSSKNGKEAPSNLTNAPFIRLHPTCIVAMEIELHSRDNSDFPRDLSLQVGNLKSFAEFRPISKSNGVEERRKVRGTIFGERINYLSCTRKRSNHGKLCKFFSKQLNSGQSVEMLLTRILNIAKRQLKASSKRPFRSAIAEKS